MSTARKTERHSVSYEQHQKLLQRLELLEAERGNEDIPRLKNLPPELARKLDKVFDMRTPNKVARDIMRMFQLIMMYGAHDGLSAQDCDNFYFTWELMETLLDAAPQGEDLHKHSHN